MALLILGLILFVCLVIVHEFGHYKAARRGGVEVEEFGLGFPPKIWGKKLKSKMELTINLLPLGGFVRLKGEHDADTTPGSYGAAPFKTKVKIMTAGVVMNLLTALVILTILALVGMPKLVDNQFTVKSDTKVVTQEILVGYVEPDSPAAQAGLESRDELVAVGTAPDKLTPIESIDTFPDTTKQYAGEKVYIEVRQGDQTSVKEVQLRSTQEVEASKNTDEPKGYLGVVPTEFVVQRSTWSAPIVAIGTAAQFTKLTLQGIGTAIASIFQGEPSKAADQVSGPVGIFVVIKDGADLGYRFILMIIAIISLTLAIMNILPIPALDGGRLFVTLLYKAMRKPLKKETEERIHGIGFAVLMGLFVLITVIDVQRFF
jgi:regulator of sigma E protease